MKEFKIVVLICLAFALQSCEKKKAKIEIQNNISQVVIQDVYWGGNYLAYSLLPGESSGVTTISEYDEDFPASYNITFVMSANNKLVYLETKEVYSLDEDDHLIIELTDSTEVFNPND